MTHPLPSDTDPRHRARGLWSHALDVILVLLLVAIYVFVLTRGALL